MITVDTIMETVPCVRWPRDRVAGALALLDTSSWVALAESARADRWRAGSLRDLRLTACRHAARLHPASVLTTWVQSVVRWRVELDRERHPSDRPDVHAVLADIEAWDGTKAEAIRIRSAVDTSVASYVLVAIMSFAAVAVAAAASADTERAAQAAFDAATAYRLDDTDACAWRTLRDLCARIDAAEGAGA